MYFQYSTNIAPMGVSVNSVYPLGRGSASHMVLCYTKSSK